MIAVNGCRHLDMKAFVLVGLLLFSNLLQAIEEPDGYRLEMYDDVVPDTLNGATRVTALDVQRLVRDVDALVIDVIPEHRRPESLPEGQLWIPVSHKGVPGALWLPDIGFGVLSDVTEKYFTSHLTNATRGNFDHPVIFYCRSDCWMSWNAAKRAMTYGYTAVYWFADGVDDWAFEDYEFENLIAAPGQRQAQASK